MNFLLRVSPGEEMEDHARQRKKTSSTSARVEPTTSEFHQPLLYRLSYKARRKQVEEDNHPRLAPIRGVGRTTSAAQSVEQRLLKSGGGGFDSRRGRRFFSLPRAVFHFLTRANAQWEIHGFTLALYSATNSTGATQH